MINHDFMHFNLFLNMYKTFMEDPNYEFEEEGNYSDNRQLNNIYKMMKIEDMVEFGNE